MLSRCSHDLILAFVSRFARRSWKRPETFPGGQLHQSDACDALALSRHPKDAPIYQRTVGRFVFPTAWDLIEITHETGLIGKHLSTVRDGYPIGY